MERKELKPIYAMFAQELIEDEDGDLYIREEADAVMDAQEQRIKELEAIPHTDNSAVIATLQERIKELEDELGRVTDAQISSKDELGQLEHIVDANKMMWVSVKDRLPPTQTHLLVAYNDGQVVPAFFLFSETRNDIGFAVTHWMPLPNPPTTEDSSDAGGKNA